MSDIGRAERLARIDTREIVPRSKPFIKHLVAALEHLATYTELLSLVRVQGFHDLQLVDQDYSVELAELHLIRHRRRHLKDRRQGRQAISPTRSSSRFKAIVFAAS